MVIDRSALLAILLNEPDAPAFEQAIEDAPLGRMSAASLLETAIVVEPRYGEAGGRELDLLIYKAGLEIVSFDAEEAHAAREAFRLYGKGRHAAGLNFGDCFAYALARTTGDTLFFKGHDFQHTDIEPALAS